MYPVPIQQEDQGRYQAKLIVNMVVVVFLIVGLLLVLQYFNFLYLRSIPVFGGWLMDMYERVFGVPQVLILHGSGSANDDSIGDWTAMKKLLSDKMMFYYEDVDVSKFSSGMGGLLKRYGLVIVEDARTINKDKLVNLDDYVKGGGNLIWVGDAGTRGEVESDGRIIANQTGWKRGITCVNQVTMAVCDCTLNKSSSCKYLPEAAEGGASRRQVEFGNVLGLDFKKNILGAGTKVEIVNTDHWVARGIRRSFDLPNVNKITQVSNLLETDLVANIIMNGVTYPGLVVNDLPGSRGNVVYFAYPPEETPEVLLPLVQQMRY